MTSATLTSGNKNFKFFKDNIGVRETIEDVVDSPFNYSEQGAIFIPKNMVDPRDEKFVEQVAKGITECITASRGRAFCLFTSYKNMNKAFDLVNTNLPKKKQGDMPKQKLIEWFKTTKGAVLFATASFWGGVDIQGDALSLVIIDKIPFPNFGDPVIKMKQKIIEEKGLNSFVNFSIPSVIITLKQGVGRLIRTKKDKGAIVIMDSRIWRKGYGKKIIGSLPPFKIMTSKEQLIEFLKEI